MGSRGDRRCGLHRKFDPVPRIERFSTGSRRIGGRDHGEIHNRNDQPLGLRLVPDMRFDGDLCAKSARLTFRDAAKRGIMRGVCEENPFAQILGAGWISVVFRCENRCWNCATCQLGLFIACARSFGHPHPVAVKCVHVPARSEVEMSFFLAPTARPSVVRYPGSVQRRQAIHFVLATQRSISHAFATHAHPHRHQIQGRLLQRSQHSCGQKRCIMRCLTSVCTESARACPWLS